MGLPSDAIGGRLIFSVLLDSVCALLRSGLRGVAGDSFCVIELIGTAVEPDVWAEDGVVEFEVAFIELVAGTSGDAIGEGVAAVCSGVGVAVGAGVGVIVGDGIALGRR